MSELDQWRGVFWAAVHALEVEGVESQVALVRALRITRCRWLAAGGWTQAEIAQRLGVCERSVRYDLARVRWLDADGSTFEARRIPRTLTSERVAA
jgi:hypothetical protein